MKKLSTCVLLCFFVILFNRCEEEEASISGLNNQITQIQDHFDQNAFSKTITSDYNVNWNNPTKQFSDDFQKNYYEYSINFIDENYSNKKGFYQVDYKIIAVENEDKSYQFYVGKFLQDLRENNQLKPSEKISFSNLTDYSGLVHMINNTKDIVYARWIDNGRSLDEKLFLGKELEIPSITKNLQEECYIVKIQYYEDWYTVIDGTGYLRGTTNLGFSLQEVCDTYWLPDINPNGGNAAGKYKGYTGPRYDIPCDDPIHGCEIELEVKESEIKFEDFEDKDCQKNAIKLTNDETLSDFGQFIAELFNTSLDFNLVFKTEDITDEDLLAHTQPLAQPGSNGLQDIEIRFSNSFLNTGTKEMIASVAIHEQLHAYMVYLYESGELSTNTSNPDYADLTVAYANFLSTNDATFLGFTQHEIMADLVQGISNTLYEVIGGGSGIDEDLCDILAWNGLTGTTAFQSEYPMLLPDGTNNPEYEEILKTIKAEALGTTETYQDEDDETITVQAKGDKCDNS